MAQTSMNPGMEIFWFQDNKMYPAKKKLITTPHNSFWLSESCLHPTKKEKIKRTIVNDRVKIILFVMVFDLETKWLVSHLP